MPRGGALGITMFLPERDTYSASKDKLESQIASLFGGRVVEEIIYGKNKVTTAASNDIERATQYARNMVTKWGLSERLGPMDYGEGENQSYSGSQAKPMSEKMAQLIDELMQGKKLAPPPIEETQTTNDAETEGIPDDSHLVESSLIGDCSI